MARLASVLMLALVLTLALGGCGGEEDAVEVEAPVRFGQAAADEVAPGERRAGIDPADAVLLYRRGDEPCEVLLAATAGLAAGPCGDALSPRVYARPERAERLQELAATYASFELEGDREELEFHGAGEQVASPAEQRMVLELARRLMTESLGLRRAEAYRLAFAWHRQGGGEQPCDDLAIYLSGEAVASSCAYRGVEVTASLTPEQLARVYDWVDRLRPFQVEGGGGAGDDDGERDSSVRLIFVGRGDDAGEDVVGEISRFAQEIYRTMTDEELARVAAERELEEEQRLLEAQMAAGLVPPPMGQGIQGQPRPGQPPVQDQAGGQAAGPAPIQGQPGQPGPEAEAEPLPPVEPSPPPPPSVGVEDEDQMVDPGPEEEDDGGNGDGASEPDDDGG